MKAWTLWRTRRDDETNDDVASEEMPEPTLSPGFAVTIRGWKNEDEADARLFADGVGSVVRGISQFFDLSRLESVVIAWDGIMGCARQHLLRQLHRAHGRPYRL